MFDRPHVPFQRAWANNGIMKQLAEGKITLEPPFERDILLRRTWMDSATIKEAFEFLYGKSPSGPDAWWRPEAKVDHLLPASSREYLETYVGYEPHHILWGNTSSHANSRTVVMLVGQYLITYCEL